MCGEHAPQELGDAPLPITPLVRLLERQVAAHLHRRSASLRRRRSLPQTPRIVLAVATASIASSA